MTFTYDSDTCRMSATVSCSQPDSSLDLDAAIVANGQYMEFGPQAVTFPATCVDGDWQMGEPPLTVMTLECQLTTPT